jgi:hypothetical protein
VAVDLRHGQARALPEQSDLRDAVEAAREQQKRAGVRILTRRS